MLKAKTRLVGLAYVAGPLPLLGPAFVAAVAYIDPGNFATNITAGSRFGYLLIWVLVASNLMAMLIQYLSAKAGIATGKSLPELCRDHFPKPVTRGLWVQAELVAIATDLAEVLVASNLMAMLIQYLSAKAGIATGKSLPELCRDHFPKPVTRGLWVQAELVAIATDLAEVLGGAIALRLLFDLPLLAGGVITAVVAFGLLGLQTRGARPFEVAITGMLLVVLVGFLYSLVVGGVDVEAAAAGLVPRFEGTETVLLATGMLGATVMPHVIYGALTQNRYVRSTEQERLALLRSQRVDVVSAMAIAGLINLAMLAVAAQSLSNLPNPVDTIEGAHAGLAATLGPTAALLFGLALLASGFAASGVGTYSGQVVMQGFLRRRIPLLARRLVTLAPALLVIAAGVDPTAALVISQVVLSFGIPFALIPLVLLTRRHDVMGALVNRPLTTFVAAVVATVICCLNVTLIGLTLAG